MTTIPTNINAALRALPNNNQTNWMTVAPKVAKKLTKKELLKVLEMITFRNGVSEHDAFYTALAATVGQTRGAELIAEFNK